MHCYQQEFFDKTERHQRRTVRWSSPRAGGPAFRCGRVAPSAAMRPRRPGQSQVRPARYSYSQSIGLLKWQTVQSTGVVEVGDPGGDPDAGLRTAGEGVLVDAVDFEGAVERLAHGVVEARLLHPMDRVTLGPWQRRRSSSALKPRRTKSAAVGLVPGRVGHRPVPLTVCGMPYSGLRSPMTRGHRRRGRRSYFAQRTTQRSRTSHSIDNCVLSLAGSAFRRRGRAGSCRSLSANASPPPDRRARNQCRVVSAEFLRHRGDRLARLRRGTYSVLIDRILHDLGEHRDSPGELAVGRRWPVLVPVLAQTNPPSTGGAGTSYAPHWRVNLQQDIDLGFRSTSLPRGLAPIPPCQPCLGV